MPEKVDWQSELIKIIAETSRNPLLHAKRSYEWGKGDLKTSWGPKKWQAAQLKALGEHLQNPATRFQPYRAAVASGHGIGKGALCSMIVRWAMDTCEDCKIIVTATTETQLRTKTWPEMGKWHRLGLTQHWWNFGATSITVKEKDHERLWRCDQITWSENNTEAFAGLHNKGKRIVVLFDEAAGIADKIWEVTEGALTDEDTEIIWLAFGNPTQNTGKFRECFGRQKHRWNTFQIDSREVEGTNKEQIRQWIEDYGEDSDFVRVRVRGEFPRAGSQQFIPSDIVALCRKYQAKGFTGLPKVLAVDVARYGDDQTVLGLRQGRMFKLLAKFRGLSTVQTAERAIPFIESESPDAIVVDGDGIGAGVVDQLQYRGYGHKLFEFHGNERANDTAKYANRRAEVWGEMRDMLSAGMQIPDDPEIEADLTGIEYGFNNKSQIQLEKKEDMKRRGLSSPDLGDCLAYSFAVKIATRKQAVKTQYVYPGQQQQSWMN